jgi:Spy/CpxP family protein refolding chaperone
MKHPIQTLAIIFSVALNVAFIGAYAYRMLSPPRTFAFEELRLDADQRARMVSSRDRFIGKIDNIGSSIIGLQAGLIDAIAADPVDQAAIQAKLSEIRAQQQLMQQTVVEHLLDHKSILRPDQRQQFFAVLKQRLRSQGMPGPPWMPVSTLTTGAISERHGSTDSAG